MSSEQHNPFALLGLPARVPVDMGALRRAWLVRSAELHPDRAADPSSAAGLLAEINEAKELLSDQYTALVSLLRVLAPTEIFLSKEMPMSLAMEMLETRDELEAAVASKDREAASRLRVEAEAAIGALLNSVEEVLSEGVVDEAGLLEARTLLNSVPAYKRVIDTLHEAGF